MKKDILWYVLVTLSVLMLTATTARCAFIGNEPEAVTCTNLGNMRISAPAHTYEGGTTVRREIPTKESTEREPLTVREQIASVSVAAPKREAVDIYELMWRTPLRTEVQMMIEDICVARDVDVRVVLAIIEVEDSNFDERAIGDNGEAFGLMQVRPDSHWDRMLRLGVQDLLDGVQNVLVGIDYLDELLDRYGGDYYKALTAYNKGYWPGYVTSYAYKVMAIAGEVR